MEGDVNDDTASHSHASGEPTEPTEVLEVFGLKLKVYNPRLAELLTMEARDALTTDVGELVSGWRTSSEIALRSEPVDTGLTEQEAPAAAGAVSAFSAQAQTTPSAGALLEQTGRSLGFELGEAGLWKSPSGVRILVRRVEDGRSMDDAAQLVQQLSDAQHKLGQETAALFVVNDQIAADTFRATIRKQNLYSEMRVISVENLEEIERLKASGRLSHRQVVLLLVPLANIDVGELLNVVRAAGGSLES